MAINRHDIARVTAFCFNQAMPAPPDLSSQTDNPAHGFAPSPPALHCPWLHFDTEWYAATYLRRPVAGEPRDALEHYTTLGVARGLGPNPFFDEGWYLASYRDARDTVGRGTFASGFAHYSAVGLTTHSPHWLFDEQLYMARRGDLTPAGLQDAGWLNAYHHYLMTGQNEGPSGSLFFDTGLFVESTGIAEHPFTALLTTPALTALRLSHYFDPAWYLATFPDVAQLVAQGHYVSALHHFLTNAAPASFAGSTDFDEGYYRARNPDIGAALASGVLRTGFQHFVRQGRLENRRPSPWFDPGYYAAHRMVAKALEHDTTLTAFDHYLRVGKSLGLATVPPPHAVPLADRPGTEAAGRDIFARMAHLRARSGWRATAFDSPDTPEISVVIVAFNQFDLTMQTLDSLVHSTGHRFEVILVDNASTDETRRIEQHVPGLLVLRNELNEGFVYAANQGMAATQGRFVLLLNNDVLIRPDALRLARDRLAADPDIGAVGGKIIRSHGMLQEAGCLVFRDGGTLGYGRDADPFDPAYDFVREVDFCSGVFLMLSRAALDAVGVLDEEYAPAYYEEVDLCARLWQAGYRVVYDPAIEVTHLEYGSSRNPDAPRALMRHNRALFRSRHAAWLADRQLPDTAMALHGRSAIRRTRVLFIDDVIPYRPMGSGFGRSADIIASLVALDCEVTVLPLMARDPPPGDARTGFAETVELLWNHDLSLVPALFAARENFYDVVWVCRTHNLGRLASVLHGAWGPLHHARVVLDTEAVVSNRDAAQAVLEGRDFDTGSALAREFSMAHLAHRVACVSELECRQLRGAGLTQVNLLGHAMPARPSPRRFADRRDILALGSLHGPGTPNADGLLWFITEVWPRVRAMLPGVRLLVGGFVADDLDPAAWFSGRDVEYLGFVPDPATLYDSSRVFLAPTRFSAGTPFKVLEAASFGLPVMATAPLARQLDWGEDAIVTAEAHDPAAFAVTLAGLYANATLWRRIRAGALKRIADDCDPQAFTAGVAELLGPIPA